MGAMGGARVRHELVLRVVASPGRATPGVLVAYEDGHWRLRLAGAAPVRGDRHEGGREAATALLRLLVPAAEP